MITPNQSLFSWVWNEAPHNARDHLVLIALADEAQSSGLIDNLTQAELALKTNSTERNLRRSIERLAAEGYISRYQRTDATSNRKAANIYALQYSDPEVIADKLQTIANRESVKITPTELGDVDITQPRPEREAKRQAIKDKHRQQLRDRLKATGQIAPLANPKATGQIAPPETPKATGQIAPLETNEKPRQNSDLQQADKIAIGSGDPILNKHKHKHKYIDITKYTDDTQGSRTPRGGLRKHFIPENWMPTEKKLDSLAKRTGWTIDRLLTYVDNFVDFWTLERPTKRAGWDGSFDKHIKHHQEREKSDQLATERQAQKSDVFTTNTPLDNPQGTTPRRDHHNYETNRRNNQTRQPTRYQQGQQFWDEIELEHLRELRNDPE